MGERRWYGSPLSNFVVFLWAVISLPREDFVAFSTNISCFGHFPQKFKVVIFSIFSTKTFKLLISL